MWIPGKKNTILIGVGFVCAIMSSLQTELYGLVGLFITFIAYIVFMRKTGLLDLIANHIVNNLVDYALGIETGLDSNGRKNRGGHQMEDLVEEFIKATGAEYYKEMYLTDIERKWGVDLSAISAEGTTTKRWDFVVKQKIQYT